MKKLFSFILSFLLSLSFFSTKAQAKFVVEKEGNAKIAKEEIIEDDLFITGKTIEILGEVKGDVFAAGEQITINGIIDGDVIAAGGILDISGDIKDDIRIVGGTIKFKEAKIGDGITMAGGNMSLDEETTITGSLLVAGGTLDSSAKVGRNLIFGTGTANLASQVGKNTYAGAGQLSLKKGTDIKGDLVYRTEEELQLDKEASIGGKTIKKDLPTPTKELNTERFKLLAKKFAWGMKVVSYFSALAVGLLILYFFPKLNPKILKSIQTKTLPNIGAGLLGLFLTIPAIFTLLATGIGASLAIFLSIFYFATIYLAKIFVGYAVGAWLSKNLNFKMSNYITLVVGLLFFYALKSLPLIGAFFKIFGTFLGFGAIYRLTWSALKKKS